jgi:DNA-binding HxlR family transcriptional regulator
MLDRQVYFKALTQAGLIDRRDFGVVPPHVEYRLTRSGQSFVPVISTMREWGDRHLRQGAEPGLVMVG